MELCGVKEQLKFPNHAFLWGFYHIHWRSIMNELFRDTRRSPVKWMAMITIKFWDIWERLWEIRNSMKFEPQGGKNDNEQIDQEIEDIHNKAPPLRMLTPGAQTLFQGEIRDKQKYSFQKKKKWVRDAKAILEGFEEDQKKSKSVLYFRKYFSAK